MDAHTDALRGEGELMTSAMTDNRTTELHEKLSKALDHAHAIGKLGEL